MNKVHFLTDDVSSLLGYTQYGDLVGCYPRKSADAVSEVGQNAILPSEMGRLVKEDAVLRISGPFDN